MGASFRANHMSVHAKMARDQRDGRTDRQTAFCLYIVDILKAPYKFINQYICNDVTL